MKALVVCALWLGLPASAVGAQELRPFENYSLHLGGVHGSVYAVDTARGSRLVATLSGGGAPVRFVADLVAGQSATVSVPRRPGEAAFEVTFTRQGERIVVTEQPMLVGSIR